MTFADGRPSCLLTDHVLPRDTILYDPIMSQCWPTVCDADLILCQHILFTCPVHNNSKKDFTFHRAEISYFVIVFCIHLNILHLFNGNL